MKKSTTVIIVVALIALALFLPKLSTIFAVAGSESMTRTAPSQVNPGAQFTVTYSTANVPARWFVAFEDVVSGGCSPTSYRNFLAGETATNDQKVVTYTAPSSGSCTFTGYYQFANGAQVSFPSKTVTLCSAATCASLGKNCGSWSNNCGGTLNCGTCGSGQYCTTAGSCANCQTCASLGKQCGSWTGNCGALSCGTCGAGQQCTQTGQCQTCRTEADTNCDNVVSFSELTSFGSLWISGSKTFAQLVEVGGAWVNG